MNYEYINIPESIRKELWDTSKLHLSKKCDVYDVETKQTYIDDNGIYYIRQILSKFDIKLNKDPLVKLIEYNFINGNYILDSHLDNVDKTILIYLYKDSTITDNFQIGISMNKNSDTREISSMEWADDTQGKKFQAGWKNIDAEKSWDNGCLIMKNNPLHKGSFRGIGKRIVLSIFTDD